MVRKVDRWRIWATPYDSGDVLLEAELDGAVRKDWVAKMKPNGGVIAPPLSRALVKAVVWTAAQANGEERAEVMLREELKRISLEG